MAYSLRIITIRLEPLWVTVGLLLLNVYDDYYLRGALLRLRKISELQDSHLYPFAPEYENQCC